MKQLLTKMKSVACAALMAGLTLGVQAEKVSYRYPVYKTTTGTSYQQAASGIAEWKIGEVDATPIVEQTTLSAGWYVVKANTTISSRIVCSGAVNLILADGVTLTASAGITVSESDSLTIFGQQLGTGALVASSAAATDAGIGGSNSAGYNITINGGIVTATGGVNSAGIGGGGSYTGYNIIINDGTVTARSDTGSGGYGAGIGGGDGGYGVRICINGGHVNATSYAAGAGIGGGGNGPGMNITINGGTVWAECTHDNNGYDGAGIGGGCNNPGSEITINGGDVTAIGGNAAAGIGSGNGAFARFIYINGGTVNATGGANGAGIGGGNGGIGYNIYINGGKITARSYKNGGGYAAGIGGGDQVAGHDIYITGGDVTAYNRAWGAGIGGGGGVGTGDHIYITGGKVLAYSETSENGESGIGCGAGVTSPSGRIYISADCTILADDDNPPQTIIDSSSVISDLYGQRCVLIKPPLIPFEWTDVANTCIDVYTDGISALDIWDHLEEYPPVYSNLTAYAVYTPDLSKGDYVFADGTMAKTNYIDTSKNPAVLQDGEQIERVYRAVTLNDGIKALDYEGGTWHIVGEGSVTDTTNLKKEAITNLVVESGVTGIGANAFTDSAFWTLRDVTLGASCTNVGDRAFKKCYGLTNVTSKATDSSTIGEYAFSGCHSLQSLSFAGAASFEEQAYTLQAAIYMKDGGIPVVYAMPTITVAGKNEHIMGKKTLADEWTDVTNFTDDEKKEYHFFKIEVR